MTKFITLALIAALPTLAAPSDASAGQYADAWPMELSVERSNPPIGILGRGFLPNTPRIVIPEGATVTEVPSFHSVRTVAQLELFVATAPELCMPDAIGWWATLMCYDVVMPGGEVQEFRSEPHRGVFHSIDGYTYTGPQTITVEYVETSNYSTCWPTGPGSCHFHHYTLLED